jgi:hypothetical protein
MQSYEIAFQAAKPFDRFLDEAEANRDLWHAVARRVPLHEEPARRIAESPGCWRLLVLADDWCGDAVNTVPVIERLVRDAPNMEMRIVPRDHFPEVRDRHLTNGSRSIPMAILLDEDGVPHGSWGPRPELLQARVMGELSPLSKTDRYREVRSWYARDRGASTADEVARMVEAAAHGLPEEAKVPCRRKSAA